MRRGPRTRLALAALACAWPLAAAAAPRPTPPSVAPPPLAADQAGGALEARVTEYLRLLGPNPAAPDLARFLLSAPTWPNRAVMMARLQTALVDDPVEADIAPICAELAPIAADAALRCAVAARAEGREPAARSFARLAWSLGVDAGIGEAAAETMFVASWGGALDAASDWRRFEAIDAPATRDAAARAAARLPAAWQALADARLAFDDGVPADPVAIARTVPPPLDRDPTLALRVARALRESGALDAALTDWTASAGPAEADPLTMSPGAAPSATQGARAPREPVPGADLLSAERDRLARALLAAGRAPDAYPLLAAESGPVAPADLDANRFLAGLIALDDLGRPDAARAAFEQIRETTPSLITRARASFWLSRAAASAGDRAAELAAERDAARLPTTFYGQQAIARIAAQTPTAAPLRAPAEDAGARFLASLEDGLDQAAAPADPAADALFAAGELPRAARLLVDWGQARRARAFVALAAARAGTPALDAAAARFALALGLPDAAVSIARRAGAHGVALASLGWPRPLTPPPGLPPGLVLGIARQESGFDPDAVSPHGALGLMQLMPATAAEVAGPRGPQTGAGRLLSDPELNVRLGAAYLGRLFTREAGDVALTIAAYNAGPRRVALWLAASPFPAAPDARDPYRLGDPQIAWIELIPFEETRNYVERVLADRAIYAAGAHVIGTLPAPGPAPLASTGAGRDAGSGG